MLEDQKKQLVKQGKKEETEKDKEAAAALLV